MDLVSHNGELESHDQSSEIVSSLRRMEVLQAVWDWKARCSSTMKEVELGGLSGYDKNLPVVPAQNYAVQLIDGTQLLNIEDQISEMSWHPFAEEFQTGVQLAAAVAEETNRVVGNIQGNTQGYSQ